MRIAIAVSMVFLVALSLASQPVRAEGLLSDFFEMIGKWFESSPLGNLFAMPVKRMDILKMSFYPVTFDFDVSDPVNISSKSTEVVNFKGGMNVDMENKVMALTESGSGLLIREAIGEITVNEMKIGSLKLSEMKLVIRSGNWNETTENGSVTIKDFLGTVIIKDGLIEMEGNASKIIKS